METPSLFSSCIRCYKQFIIVDFSNNWVRSVSLSPFYGWGRQVLKGPRYMLRAAHHQWQKEELNLPLTKICVLFSTLLCFPRSLEKLIIQFYNVKHIRNDKFDRVKRLPSTKYKKLITEILGGEKKSYFKPPHLPQMHNLGIVSDEANSSVCPPMICEVSTGLWH